MRAPGYAARRVKQTFKFSNGPSILLGLASSKTPWRREELTFKAANGVAISVPNVDGARLAAYEQFADDVYGLDLLTSGLPAKFTVIDVGAHVGSFSIAVASRFPGATVHSYEASPDTAVWLERNIAQSGLTGRVVPHAVALSDHEGTLSFARAGAASVHSGLTAPEITERVDVPSTTLAKAFADAGGAVHVAKFDAEGAEYDSILSSPQEIWSSVQRVVMEYHPVTGRSWDELEAYFASVGLTVTRRDPGERPGLGLAWLTREESS